MRLLPALVLSLILILPAAAQDDPMRAGPLDNGKMWTFENPPTEYLEETYGLRPDAAWYDRARMAALRLPGCSASFVSADGLVVTNHHCVRGPIVDVTREGESLLDDGFAARAMEEERAVPGLYVDQLVAIADVTGRMEAAMAEAQTDAERVDARETEVAAIEEELEATAGDGHSVQVVSLYNGGRFSAYTFRRYDDLRLVAAPEDALGFFGGDPDNFTYPRYALDFAFLRVYGDDGEPLDSSDFYFPWTDDGVAPGDLVFVIGNPGSTDRGDTVAQLETRRGVQVPAMLEFLDSRVDALRAYLATDPPNEDALRNQLFGITNAQKAYRGRRDALADPVIMSRRRDFERSFRVAVEADPELRAEYGDLFDRMAAVQAERRALRADRAAFNQLTNSRYSSLALLRGALALRLLSGDASVEDDLRDVADRPGDLERAYLTAQLRTLARHRPDLAQAAMDGRTPEETAEAVITGSVLSTDKTAEEALDAGTLTMEDPAVALAAAVLPAYADFASADAGLGAQEEELARQLGRARFAVYGTTIPPDATFSPRFTDGVVRGYAYNGTVAPPYTTLFGLYDHYHSYGPDSEWTLPDRWLPAPPDLNLATPLNFVSTSDTIGGNSGSPAVNRDLELVGLNFDRTIEGLSRDHIYFADRGRNVMVDARAVIEALDVVYDLDRIVAELRTGAAVASEADADTMRP